MKKRILFVSQDPGSGNALSPVICAMKDEFDVTVFATSHSKFIFQSNGISYVDMDGKDFWLQLNFIPDLMITGASAGNCIEKQAILYGRIRKITTISILDFWSNFWQRYSDIDKNLKFCFLPDYVFVMDDMAKEQMLLEAFSENNIVVTGNPYFDTFRNNSNYETTEDGSLLFISQPNNNNNNNNSDGNYETDKEVFNTFMDVVSDFPYAVIIRPHPKEDADYFLEYINKNNVKNVSVDTETEITKLVRQSKIIFGKHSMVLFQAVFMGKLVISFQPQRKDFDPLITNKLGLSYLVQNKDEFKETLTAVLEGKIKPKTIPELKYYNDGKCTFRALNKIHELLS